MSTKGGENSIPQGGANQDFSPPWADKPLAK